MRTERLFKGIQKGVRMNAGSAKQLARDWVRAQVSIWDGLRAAHLVGGLATMPDDAPFPAYKDVDLHLIFANGSPMLQPTGPFMNIIETTYEGMLIEAGIKAEGDYDSPEAVLGNPEIAGHLSSSNTLYDPEELLSGLVAPVRSAYAERRWVQTRINAERSGLEGTLSRLPVLQATHDRAGAFMLIGYSCIYAAAALQVAALRPPRIGSQMLLHVRRLLQAHDRSDLYEGFLAMLGVQQVAPNQVVAWLAEGIELFDLAVQVRRTPHPFQHKLHAHLRPYFVDSCRAMLAAGDYREACTWLIAYYLACTDVLLVDGPAEDRPRWAARRDALLAELGLASDRAVADRLSRAQQLHAACFALADEIVRTHPDVTDGPVHRSHAVDGWAEQPRP